VFVAETAMVTPYNTKCFKKSLLSLNHAEQTGGMASELWPTQGAS
jgi:hypothetical protein